MILGLIPLFSKTREDASFSKMGLLIYLIIRIIYLFIPWFYMRMYHYCSCVNRRRACSGKIVTKVSFQSSLCLVILRPFSSINAAHYNADYTAG